jgi:ribose/xylose/arabinose/galactoside ABC-type transport system permease subunit
LSPHRQASGSHSRTRIRSLRSAHFGGTSILGGDGAIWRTVIGVLFIAPIGNGFTLLVWNPLYEQITLGVILLLAVGGDAWSRLRTT